MFHCLVIKVLNSLSLRQLVYFTTSFSMCQALFSSFFKLERRRRDLNPRAAINDLLPFQGSPFSRLGTSPQAPKSTGYVRPVECIERRGWDSNPRALADKRFSRPPRYDHFDTSPYFNFFQLKIAVCISDFVILSKSPILVNRFFKIFSKFFRQRFLRLPDPPVW